MKFLQTLRNLYKLSQRVETIQSDINALEDKLTDSVRNYSREFEKRIQQMTFEYTRDLDDTKSDYLKRYLEVRMNCIQNEITQIPLRMMSMEKELKALILEKDESEIE